MAPRIIHDNNSLVNHYEELVPGDLVVGRLRLRDREEHLLIDLLTRGVILIPSAQAQLCSRSKVMQTRLLGQYMIPHTRAVYDLHDLMAAITDYGKQQVTEVVCKLDQANGGQGILKFASVEDVYTQAVLGILHFPFVIQPFLPDCLDYRVVMLGDEFDAYRRFNPHNFRHNLHCGGASEEVQLTPGQLELCHQIMRRAGFPYAHLDFLVTPMGDTWLSEINLRGGLRGSHKLSQQDYLRKINEIHEQLLSQHLNR